MGHWRRRRISRASARQQHVVGIGTTFGCDSQTGYSAIHAFYNLWPGGM